MLTSRLVSGKNITGNVFGSKGEGFVSLMAGYNPTIWKPIERMQRELQFLKRRISKGFVSASKNRSDRRQRFVQYRMSTRQLIVGIMERMLERKQRFAIEDLRDADNLPVVRALKKIYPTTRVQIGSSALWMREEFSGRKIAPDVSLKFLVVTAE